MDILIMAGQFILSLSILIVLHECGHFFPAKWFNTRVEKFYLFFDPWFSLFKIQKGDTEYGIGWLPLGGYVKISGMIDESFDTEQLVGPPKEWEFRAKPAWQRLIIMLGGVTVNFILGIVLFAFVLFNWGEQYIPTSNLTYGIAVDSLGMDMGLQDGDHILKVGSEPFERYNPGFVIQEIIINSASTITVKRNEKEQVLPIDPKFVGILSKRENQGRPIFAARMPFVIAEVPEGLPGHKARLLKDDKIIELAGQSAEYYHEISKIGSDNKGQTIPVKALRGNETFESTITLTEEGKLGVMTYAPVHYFESESHKYSLMASIPAGFNKAWGFLTGQIKAFGQIFKGKIKAKDSLGSFITIGSLFGNQWDWSRFWNLTAMLSVLLGFINLLPIPALDGGHVMFLLWEVVTGKKPNDRFLEYATMIGFFLLIILMFYAIGLDISRLF